MTVRSSSNATIRRDGVRVVLLRQTNTCPGLGLIGFMGRLLDAPILRFRPSGGGLRCSPEQLLGRWQSTAEWLSRPTAGVVIPVWVDCPAQLTDAHMVPCASCLLSSIHAFAAVLLA